MAPKAKVGAPARAPRGAAARPKAAKGLTKAAMVTDIATASGMTKAQVNGALDAMTAIISRELKAGRPVVITGLVKLTLHHRAATPSRQGVAFGQPTVFAAKPARRDVRARVLKGLKDLVV